MDVVELAPHVRPAGCLLDLLAAVILEGTHLHTAHGKIFMPGFGNGYSDAEIAAVVPASPVPLTPSGLVVQITSWWSTVMAGTSSARGIA